MNISVINKNELLIQMLKPIMKKKKYNINTFNNINTFIESDIMGKTDIVFIDIILSDKNNITMIKTLYNDNPNMEIIIVSVENEAFVMMQLKNSKFRYFIHKPFTHKDISKCINQIHLERQLISDFIKNENPQKNILITYNKTIPSLNSIMRIPISKLLKNNEECKEFSGISLIITDLENTSNELIMKIIFKNLINLSNKSNKFIVQYHGTITDMKVQFRKIPNIYSYLVKNSYILSENMS